MGALEQVTVLMTIMRQLTDVMEHERQLLRGMRLEAMADLQSEKAALADAYEVEIRRFHQSAERVGELDPKVREELHLVMQDFQRALSANLHALQAAQSVLERLMRTISDSLGDAGVMRPSQGGEAAANGQVIPVAFDRRI